MAFQGLSPKLTQILLPYSTGVSHHKTNPDSGRVIQIPCLHWGNIKELVAITIHNIQKVLDQYLSYNFYILLYLSKILVLCLFQIVITKSNINFDFFTFFFFFVTFSYFLKQPSSIGGSWRFKNWHTLHRPLRINWGNFLPSHNSDGFHLCHKLYRTWFQFIHRLAHNPANSTTQFCAFSPHSSVSPPWPVQRLRSQKSMSKFISKESNFP